MAGQTGIFQSCEWRADAIANTRNGLRLTLSDRGGKARPLGCPEIHTNARFGYGLYEARIRSAAGSGLVTAFFTYIGPPAGSPEHDEIDFEFLGKDPHTVNVTEYTNDKPYGKVIQLGFDASETFHNLGSNGRRIKFAGMWMERWFSKRLLMLKFRETRATLNSACGPDRKWKMHGWGRSLIQPQ
jgi:beta-glucanase (GH16 family)